MRIRFAEPRPPGHTVYDHVLLPRLGLPLMATMLAKRGHDAAVFCEMLTPIDVHECLSADLVGLSATTSTVPASYRLCDQARAAGIDTVIGGPHVTFRVDEALDHARFVVRGEGHMTILELVEAIETGSGFDSILGLSWRDEHGEAHHNADRPRCSQEEFESLPIPDLSFIRGHEKMGVKPIMTQWAAPSTATSARSPRSSPGSCATGEPSRCSRSCAGSTRSRCSSTTTTSSSTSTARVSSSKR